MGDAAVQPRSCQALHTQDMCLSRERSVTLLKHKVADQAAVFDKLKVRTCSILMDTFQKYDAKKSENK